MEKYKDQFTPLYDASVILNPFIEKDFINVDKGIKYIETKMKSLGWKQDNQETR